MTETVTIAATDTEGLLSLPRFGAMWVEPDGGDIVLGKQRTQARNGRRILEGDRSTEVALEDETVYAFNPGSGPVDVHYGREGFLSWLQPRSEVDVDVTATSVGQIDTNIAAVGVGSVPIDIQAAGIGSVPISLDAVGVGTVPISLDAVGVGSVPVDIDAAAIGTVPIDIDAQSIGDVGIDINNQSVPELSDDVVRRSAEGVTEVDADQTADISPGGTVVTTTQAAANSIYDFQHGEFELLGDSNASNFPVPLTMTLRTESQNVELAAATAARTGGNAAGRYRYQSGAWREGIDTRAALDRDLRIDASNGIEMAVTNDLEASYQWADDFENGVDGGWSGDTTQLTAQTGTVLNGTQSGELTANNANRTVNFGFGGSTTPLAWLVEIDNRTGNSNDYVEFRQYWVGGGHDEIRFSGIGNVEDQGLNFWWDSWTANQTYIIYHSLEGTSRMAGTDPHETDNVGGGDLDHIEIQNKTSGSGQTANVYLDVVPVADLTVTNDRFARYQFARTEA